MDGGLNMSNLKLTVNIDTSVFPELNLPINPNQSKDLKGTFPQLRGKAREDYDNYYQAMERVMYEVRRYLRDTPGQSYSNDSISASFDYEPKIPHTYKFLGMDIDEDYRAVIPVGDGCVIVGNLYSTEDLLKIDKFHDDYRRFSERFSPEDVREADRIIKNSSSEIARRLSTAMKSGALFSVYKKASDSMKDFIQVAELLPLVDSIKDYSKTNGAGSSALDFKSILLNLIHEAKNKIDKMTQDDNAGTSSVIIIIKCFIYWNSILKKYNDIYKTLASIDLWQAQNKKMLGEDDFNKRVASKEVFKIQDTNTFEVQPGIPSISGIARNWDVADPNINREEAYDALSQLTKTIGGKGRSDLSIVNDLMISCIDTEKFENPYDLTTEELQAVSNYDSLQYIDEDANLCMESYNMEDPDERVLFIKSAIKSYERNFKDYKPKANYDVTEAMSDLIERGERFKSRIIDDASSNEEDESTYVVTSTDKEIKLGFDKRNLLKVSKLIDKQITAIDKQFL